MTTRPEEPSDSVGRCSGKSVAVSNTSIVSLPKTTALPSEGVQHDSSSASDSHFGSLPDLPQRLLARRRRSSNISANNKAKVIVVLQSETEAPTVSCLSIEPDNRFIKLARPLPRKETGEAEQPVGISQAPKLFPVDGVYTFPMEKEDLYAAALGDQIVGILDGFDGSVIYFNNARQQLSRAESTDTNSSNLELFPTAVNWLFRVIEDDPNSDNLQCHVAVSALELNYSGSSSWDLLTNPGNPSLQQTCDTKTEPIEIPVTNASEALNYVDAAKLESQRLCHLHLLEEPSYPGSHLFFTLHLYRGHQDKFEEDSMGRMKHSRLHIVELVNLFGQDWQPLSWTSQTSSTHAQRDFLQYSVLANSLMMLTGQMPLNLTESRLIPFLQKCISENIKKTSLVMHTFAGLEYYMQNLNLLQFSAKFQNYWKRQANARNFSLTQRQQGDTSDVHGQARNNTAFLDRTQRLCRPGRRLLRRRPIASRGGDRSQGLEDAAHASHSDIEYSSSSEQSCTTVIYLGRSHPLRRKFEMSSRMVTDKPLDRFATELADYQTKGVVSRAVLPTADANSQENVKERRHSADDQTSPGPKQAQPSRTLPPQVTTRHRESCRQRQRFKQRQQHLLTSRSSELWVDGPKSKPGIGFTAWTRRGGVVKDLQTENSGTDSWTPADNTTETRGAVCEDPIDNLKEGENQVRCQPELDQMTGAFNPLDATTRHLRTFKQGHCLADLGTRRPELHQTECCQSNPRTQISEDRGGLFWTEGSPMLNSSHLRRKSEVNRKEVPQAQQSRVTPFVKEWIERQNNALSTEQRGTSMQHTQHTSEGDTWQDFHLINNPISCHEALTEAAIKSGPAVDISTPLTSVRSRFSKNAMAAAYKGARGKDSPIRILSPTKIRSPLTPSRSLPRTGNAAAWDQQSPFGDSSLTRVARWVESVSKESSSGCLGPITCKLSTFKDPVTSPMPGHHLRRLPPSRAPPAGAIASAAITLDTEVKIPQADPGSRIGSAPAERFPSPHCLATIKPLKENTTASQCQIYSGTRTDSTRCDSRKPDGASDPGLVREPHPHSTERKQKHQQVSSSEFCQTELPRQRVVSKRQTRLRRFADFFVCSPNVPTRQNAAAAAGPGTRPSTSRVRRMCAPFFWPSLARDARESELSDDVLSVDSVGMLFTTSIHRKDDRSISCSLQVKTSSSEIAHQNTETPVRTPLKSENGCKPGDPHPPEKAEDPDSPWLGFVPNPRFTDCAVQPLAGSAGLSLPAKLQSSVSMRQDMASLVIRTTTADNTVPIKYNEVTIHGSEENYIVPTTAVIPNNQKVDLNPIRQRPIKVVSPTSAKCVSQSSSSGLGSEHSCADSAVRTHIVNDFAAAPADLNTPTVRCYCKPHAGRAFRCKARGRYGHAPCLTEHSDAYMQFVKGSPQTEVHRTLPYLADPNLSNDDISTGPSPVIEGTEQRCFAGGGGHASSGYESILRDSEVSSHSESASESSMGRLPATVGACQCGALVLSPLQQQLSPLESKNRDDAACQTSPFPLEYAGWGKIGTPEVKNVQSALEGSLTLTESFSEATASVIMDSSTTSKNSAHHPLSPSTSKRSISVPAQSEHTSEESTSSLPSVRRVSPLLNRVQSSMACVQLSDSQALQDSTAEVSYETTNEDNVNEARKMKILSLLSRQEALKAELTVAKSRLLADPGSWGFDLNVTERMDLDDECFLEALENETELLQQRVNACNFHVKYMSYFHPPSLGSDP